MFLHPLNKEDKIKFLAVAKLICLSDNPVLVDGKSADEITGQSDLSKVAFRNAETEEKLMMGYVFECGFDAELLAQIFSTSGAIRTGMGGPLSQSMGSPSRVIALVQNKILSEIQSLPLVRQNLPEERIRIAAAVLAELLKDAKESLPAVPKIMLFELMQLCLADGIVSNVEQQLLKEFARLHEIEDFIFDDLLERAKGINRATIQAASVIFE